MGGCASKPKDQDGPNPEVPPADNPAAPEQTVRSVDGDAPTEAKTENVEESKVEPLVDLSEPKPEESTAAAGEELAPGISELKAEAPVESAETKEEEVAADDKAAEEAEEAAAENTDKEAAADPVESSH
ncbi:neuromodulin [Cocos nucifera]|uniref:Neuromodulin n=1 Tax=Cocos nucifera TaxID=13894 RepID=A0A8K0N8C4_COCNU|nr:neuromodulin [Cocos nucifera]